MPCSQAGSSSLAKAVLVTAIPAPAFMQATTHCPRSVEACTEHRTCTSMHIESSFTVGLLTDSRAAACGQLLCKRPALKVELQLTPYACVSGTKMPLPPPSTNA